MGKQSLEGRNILIVEDEYVIAVDFEQVLHQAGATVVGPVASVDEALGLLDSDVPIDGAILDVNLRGERVYPVADRLLDRAVPIVFATGYGDHDLPERFARIPRLEKPLDPRRMEQDLSRALQRR